MFGMPLWMYGRSAQFQQPDYSQPDFTSGPYGREIGAGPTPFDEEEARDRARRAGRGALLGGMLDSYLNRGQDVGRAFELQRDAYGQSYDRSEQGAQRKQQEYRQRQQDAAVEEDRRSRITDRATDNERLRKADEAKAKAEETKAAAEEKARVKELEHRRALVEQVRKVNPDLADQLATQVEAEKFPTGEGIGATAPKEPRESRYAEAREERSVAAAERSATTAERAEKNEERRAVAERADRIYATLRSKAPPFLPENAEMALRVKARDMAEQELGVAPASAKPKGSMTTEQRGKLSQYEQDLARIRGGQTAAPKKEAAPKPGTRLRFNPLTGELE